MSDIEYKSIEPLLWLVHDECMDLLTDHRQNTISTDEKINRLILAIPDLAKALAGGYCKDGYKGE